MSLLWNKIKLKMSRDSGTRGHAASSLGYARDRRALEPLLAALRDSAAFVRANAAEALGRIGDARAVVPLISMLDDSDGHVRLAAISALGTIGDARAVSSLIAVLKEGNSISDHQTVEALRKIGAAAILPLIAALDVKDSSGRGEAVLGRIYLKDDDPPEQWRAAYALGSIAEALGRIGDARAVNPLIVVLRDSDRPGQWGAARALGWIGDARSVEPLIVALGDSDPSLRSRAAIALGQIGDARGVKPLTTALKDVDDSVRSEATKSLTKMGNLGEGVLVAALYDDSDVVRWAAREALGKIGEARDVEPLIAAIRDRDDDVRRIVAEAMEKARGQSDIPSLVNVLEASGQDSDAEVLRELDWYPDKKKRVEIVTRSWRLGVILGFPEAIDPALRALFKEPREYRYARGRDDLWLLNICRHSSFSLDIANLTLISSSYESNMRAFQFWDVYYSVEKSDAAVAELCRLASPITTNILHLIKNKLRREFHMSDDDGRSWEEYVDFQSQRTMATRELERRGNPAYDLDAYLKH
jgi:HEAT repeat protein